MSVGVGVGFFVGAVGGCGGGGETDGGYHYVGDAVRCVEGLEGGVES